MGFLILALSGCAGGSGDGGPGAGPVPGDWYRPAVDTRWQIQLQGTINTAHVADVYDVDLFDTEDSTLAALKAAGRRVMCYFSAGTYEPWRTDAEAFRAEEIGEPLEDFPDERWLDVRSSRVLAVMEERIALAAARGCDGVDPDNVDGFANETGFPLTAADQLHYNKALAQAAHARGLAVGLKNDLEQVSDLVASFDFAINEECHEYEECDLLAPFVAAGKPVLNIEYAEVFKSEAGFAALCADAQQRQFHTLVLDLALDDALRMSCGQ